MTRALPSKFIQSMPEPDESLKAIRETVVAIKRNMEVLTGQAKPPGTTAVTWDDLVALGLADTSDGSSSNNYVDSERVSAAALSLTSGAAADVVSIPLPAGDWDVFFSGRFGPAAGTTVTGAYFSISNTSGNPSTSPSSRQSFLAVPNAGLLGGGVFQTMNLDVGPARFVISTPTTIYAVVFAQFSGGTLLAYGHLQARSR